MSKIGISPAEARHLVGQQGNNTDDIRGHIATIDTHVNSLAHSTYVSDTTNALAMKWESETKPALEKIVARSEAAQAGTNSAVEHQLATQASNASSIRSV